MLVPVETLVECPKEKKKVDLSECLECEYFTVAHFESVFSYLITHIECDYEE